MYFRLKLRVTTLHPQQPDFPVFNMMFRSFLTLFSPIGFLLSFTTLFATSSTLLWAEAEPIRTHYSTEQVSPNVYVVHGPNGFPSPANQGFMNNPGFILTQDGVVVIDPGSSVQVGRMVLDAIDKVTDQPVVACFATHIHGDHWLGNQAITARYPQAKLFAHPELIKQAEGGEAQNWMDLMIQLTQGATEGTLAVIPDQPVQDGDIMNYGEISISVHHSGPAHTDTDIALLVSPNNVLFSGDLVFNDRVGRMDDGTYTGLATTLEALIALSPEHVVPGHGQTEDATLLEESLRLYAGIYEVVEEKFEEGLSDYEIKPFVVERLSEFADWGGFDESIGRLVSLAYLEVEENNF